MKANRAKTVLKYLLLLIIAVLLGEAYSLVINAGFNFSPIFSGQMSVFQFLRDSFNFETVFMFTALFFYMVFFIKFLTKLFK